MSKQKWNEAGRIWEEDHTWLDDEQQAQCSRANESDMFPSRGWCRTGNTCRFPKRKEQKHVEHRFGELTEIASRKLGMDRRRFLASTGGMTVEMFEPEAYAQAGTPRDLFVFDDQLHMVRGSQGSAGVGLRALAQGPTSGGGRNSMNPGNVPDERGDTWGVWNPALVGLPNEPENFLITQFIKDVYLDSQVNVALLSNVTASVINLNKQPRRAPRNRS